MPASNSTEPVEVFRRLTNGVYVVGVTHQGRENAFTAAWLTQVSFSPLLVMLSVNPDHASWPLLTAARGFAVSVLPEGREDLAGHFGLQSGREVNKLVNHAWRKSPANYPVHGAAIAWLDCAVEAEHPAGDHVLVVARVTAGEVLDAKVAPLAYRETGNLDGSAALYPPTF